MFFILLCFSFFDLSTNILMTRIYNFKNEFVLISSYYQIAYLVFEMLTISVFYFTIIFKGKIDNKKSIIIITTCLISILITTHFTVSKNTILNISILEFIIINILGLHTLIGETKQYNYKLEKKEIIINRALIIFINLTASYYIILNSIGNSENPLTTSLNFINDFGYMYLFLQIKNGLKWAK